MFDNITLNWWPVALRGLFAILFGIVAFVWPGLTLEVLVFLFGFYSIADGVFGLMAAFSLITAGHRGWLILEAVFSIVIGILTLLWPTITALALLLLIASYAFVTGTLEIAAAVRPAASRGAGNNLILGLSGVLSIAFGLLLVIWPDSGLLSLVWLIGFYALFFGSMLLGMAYQLYKLHRNGPHQTRGRDQLTA